MTEGTFTQEQVKHLINVEAIKSQITRIGDDLGKLTKSFEKHADKSEQEMNGLFDEIRKGEKDLMECRTELRDEVYGNFVQKKELRIWLAIAVFVMSTTTAAVQWFISTSDHKNTQIAEQVAEILKTHENGGGHGK